MNLNLENASSSGEMTGFSRILKSNCLKYDNLYESKCLLAVFEQQLFIWNVRGSCILTAELGKTDINSIEDYNVLMTTNPPVFEVDCLTFNRIGTLLAVVGHKGVFVVQIPWMSRILADKRPILCRSWLIAERFFTCLNRMDILQVSWHPGSLNCTHIVILSSDNYLRLYDATDSQTPLQAIQLGASSPQMQSQMKISFSANFGDGAVSFDFGPPEYVPNPKTSQSSFSIEQDEPLHPIYILHSNGDVYQLQMPLKKKNLARIKVQGPLAMYPSAEDNYGVDACSLVCLHSNPPIIVVAMSSGIIYHCLLLDSESAEEENQLNSSWMLSVNNESEVALYVHGSIELSISPSGDLSDSDSLPISLHKDVMCNNKYYCCVSSGVHAVVTPIVQRLEEISRGENVDNLIGQLQENDSYVEHILCTRPLSGFKEVPVIGLAFAIMDKGLTLICLLSSWELISLRMLSTFQPMINPLLLSDQSQSELKGDAASESSFGQQIQRLCQRSISAPLVKTHANADDEVVSESWQLLLFDSTTRFREAYIDRLTLMHENIQLRNTVLVRHKAHQMQELEIHLKLKDELRNKAEQLAEKYENVYANQQLLFERIENVMKLLQQRYPVLSNAEVNMKRDLLEMKDKVKTFNLSLEQLKKKLILRKEKLKQAESKQDLKDIGLKMQTMNLGDTQMRHIKEILHQEGESISKLVKTVVALKRDI